MIQLNLLPDVKLEFIRAQRTSRMIISVALLVTAGAVTILVLLLSFGGLQKKHLSDLNKDITTKSSQLKNQPQIDRILTIQNQLASLNTLHDQKPAASRLFNYLNQVTPTQETISSFTVDFNAKTVSISGNADALSSVNKFVDTLKFTNYKVKGDSTVTPAFSNVVLASFGLTSPGPSTGGANDLPPATFTITLAYDPAIFDITKSVKLTIPAKVTTRSEIDQPTALFKEAPKTSTEASH